jgi:hypothetical protein
LSQRLKSILQFLLFFGLGGALLYFAFVNLDLDYDKVLNGFKQANYGWLAAALINFAGQSPGKGHSMEYDAGTIGHKTACFSIPLMR